MIPFSFATGIENSSPTIANGRIRRDQMAECGHYANWRTDFELVRQLGIRTLRYGVPLYRAWLGPGRYDWEFSDQAFGELKRLGIAPIADLCHFGVPDWIGNFQNPDFPELFTVYATAFAERYPWIDMFTPVNEIYTCARSSALFGWWNEQEKSLRSFVTALKHLAKANVLAMHAIARLRPKAVFVQSEAAEYFHPSAPEAAEAVAIRNVNRFLSLDFTYGRPLDARQRNFVMDNGMSEDELLFFERHGCVPAQCILGTDYYSSNEHVIHPDGSRHPAQGRVGYPMIARDYYERYRLPLMHTETNLDQGPSGREACEWLDR
ncbi:MAG TPA: family 1 glycosylhydrolase, partial [Telluria sp.]